MPVEDGELMWLLAGFGSEDVDCLNSKMKTNDEKHVE